MASTPDAPSDTTPEIGLLTWDAEGMEGGPYHSRVLQVPTDSSGLTLGRGYDMKERTPAAITADLTTCDVAPADAALIARAAGLAGPAARRFIADNQLGRFEISKAGQKKLFLITYGRLKTDVERISAKPDVVAAYGACDWPRIAQPLIDLLVDLRFRGDYTGASRALVQRPVASNDLAALAQAMKVAANWTNVPRDRFMRRCTFLDRALAARSAG